MYLNLRGHDVPRELMAIVPLLTDHAQLIPQDVIYDRQRGTVRIPIKRYPLLKRRRVFPSRYDHEYPQDSLITIQNVHSCDVSEKLPAELGGKVHLMFGIQCAREQIYLCSAEEDHGEPCFSITIAVSELDIELDDAGL